MPKHKTAIRPYEVSRYLKSDAHVAAYISDALKEESPCYLIAALRDATMAKGMSDVAKQIGLSKEDLDRVLSPAGGLKLDAFLKILRVLGVKLQAVPVPSFTSQT